MEATMTQWAANHAAQVFRLIVGRDHCVMQDSLTVSLFSQEYKWSLVNRQGKILRWIAGITNKHPTQWELLTLGCPSSSMFSDRFFRFLLIVKSASAT